MKNIFYSYLLIIFLTISSCASVRILSPETHNHNYPKKEIKNDNVVDTLILARDKFPGSPTSLDALCKRFGIDLSQRDKHGALLDANLLAEVYLELTGGRQSSLVLKQPSNNARSVIQDTETVHKKLEFISAFVTKEEEKEHSNTLKDCSDLSGLLRKILQFLFASIKRGVIYYILYKINLFLQVSSKIFFEQEYSYI